MNDELLDLVDEFDQVIGQKYRSEVYEKKLHNFRVINAFIANDKGQLWIPLRSPHKKLFPSCLDVSVGGHVSTGEDYMEAFEREAREELNLEVATLNFITIAKLFPHNSNVSAFMHVYIINTNITPNYNREDFVSAEWISIPEIQEKIKSGAKAKSDLPILLNILKDYLISNEF
ncbi:NUDIX domain-containing protein [Candidatus Dependentiae bacterium]|nr:NUDIX domain-containing protein [Candidatus Dependentiae bacterium]